MARSTKTLADCYGKQVECASILEKRRGVLLINLGTPNECTTQSVRRYLSEFLADPYVIKLPRRWRWLNRPLARMIAQFRAAKSTEAYRKVWTDRGSPLKFITEDQVYELKKILAGEWQVFYAMRYANPSIGDTLLRIVEEGVTDLIVIPMYPQYSGPSTGTALDELYRCTRRFGLELNIQVHNTWYQDAGYIDAQASLIHEQALAAGLSPDDTILLYSTHSLPQSYIADGDPYESQIRFTMELVNQRLGWPANRSQLSFQSKLGPVPWLEPSTETALKDLAEVGEKRVLVCPISFTADCLETIEEVGMTYANQFAEVGGKLYLCPALNTYEPFIKSLASLVRRGSRPRNGSSPVLQPLMDQHCQTTTLCESIDSLMMIGVCTESRLDLAGGPKLFPVTHAQFHRIKRSQYDTLGLLKNLNRDNDFRESWLFNTCSRFEYYALLNGNHNDLSLDNIVSEVSRQLMGDHQTDMKVNVLRGADAWHHLLRTAAGFHSSLPGDTEVLEQLQSALRMAIHINAAGPDAQKLIGKVQSIVEELRTTTPWGRFSCKYCYAALYDFLKKLNCTQNKPQCVVIGGSTTSRSILQVLIEHFEISSENLTLIYRGGGRQRLVKLLRQAIGQGRRILVNKYCEPEVSRAIAQADIVFLGVDRREPILTSSCISSLRDFTIHPLTIIDFNTFGSCEDFDEIAGIKVITASQLEAEVARYTDALLDDVDIHKAAVAAQRVISAEVNSARSSNELPARTIQFAASSIEAHPSSNGSLESTFINEGDSYAQPAPG